MSQRIVQVDSFASHPFAGNPAGVCLLSQAAEDGWMRDVAREMNLSETAFLVPLGVQVPPSWSGAGGGIGGEAGGTYGKVERTGDKEFRLRWFTPATEVTLCGHATLAGAHVLFEAGLVPTGAGVRFYTRSGVLRAERAEVEGEPWIAMDFPSKPPQAADLPNGLLPALGLAREEVTYVGRNALDFLVEVTGEDVVRRLVPDFGALQGLEMRGVMVTSVAGTGAGAAVRSGHAEAGSPGPAVDFVSRFFAPAVGVDEDPVTGSAHCCLAPYWSERLGRSGLVGFQASARGGIVRVEARGERVRLMGQAVTVIVGELLNG